MPEPAPEKLPGGNTLWQQSGVSEKGEPFVQLIIGTHVIAQMDVEAARDYGRSIIEVAEAAEQDAFVFDWVTNVVGSGPEQAAGLLNEFRKYRLKRTGRRSGMEVIPTDPPPTAKRRLMGEQWEMFSRSVFNNETPDFQRKEMRRAFYAGAQGVIFKVIASIAPDTEPTEADIQVIQDLYEELQAFEKLVEEGRA